MPERTKLEIEVERQQRKRPAGVFILFIILIIIIALLGFYTIKLRQEVLFKDKEIQRIKKECNEIRGKSEDAGSQTGK
jgi:FtsZ-interacting cell division protein ZipA